MRTNFCVAVFDEIQKCKTAGAKVTRAVALLHAQYRLGLSGTPIMNSGKEMITLLKYRIFQSLGRVCFLFLIFSRFGLCLIDADYFTIGREPDGK